MKILNFNWELKDLNGNNIGNAGVLLAEMLVMENKGDAIKYFDWAMSLNGKKTIEIDDSDLLKIKQLINNNERLTLLVKAQLLRYLEHFKIDL